MEHRDPPDELAAAHPALRTVAPPEAPYPGVLRRVGAATRLFVDAADYAGVVAWECDRSGHVLAPLEVARRRGGHDIVLEHCVERVDDLLVRRGGASPPSHGEIVTLAVSLRRGLAELLAAGGDVAAQWWLTDDGRPVLVCSASGDRTSDSDVGDRDTARRSGRSDAAAVGPTATEATAGVVTRLRQHASSTAVSDALDALLEATGHARALTRDADLLEGALFAAASPLPIDRETSSRRSSLAGLVPEPRETVVEPADRWEELLHGHLDSELADLAAAALRSVRARMGRRPAGRSVGDARRGVPGPTAPARPADRGDVRGRRRGRARPWLVAGCLAAAVIAVGLLWPSTSGADTAAAVIGASAAPTGATDAASDLAAPVAADPPTQRADEAESASPGAAASSDPDDPVAAAAALLAAASHCDADMSCAAALVEDPAGPTAARLVAVAVGVAVDAATPELVDTYGGAAVVRVAHHGSSSLVVVVRATPGGGAATEPSRTGWLVRDVYDVADQP